MKASDAVTWQATCQKCGAGYGSRCKTPSKRNHPERVHAAIRQSLYDLEFPNNEGLRLRERARKRAADRSL